MVTWCILTGMKADDTWLDAWAERLRGQSVLELGAGPGIDSACIGAIAGSLVSTDRKPNDAKRIAFMDHSEPFPFPDASFDVVVASLTLHYFSWSQTERIIGEIGRVLTRGGLLVCRVNSVKDTQHGSVGFPEVDARYYQVNERLKRFFTRDDIVALFQQAWTIEHLVEKQIDRYERPKVVWEFGAVKAVRV